MALSARLRLAEAGVRVCQLERPPAGSCGFHLSRTQWDPYPWVSGVEGGSPAERAGLRPGDCVLEVNGEDILGRRIGQVADKVRQSDRRLSLLLWNPGSEAHAPAVCGGGATPVSLQRLTWCLQAVVQLLECPVCLEVAPPPVAQCYNGHVVCARCRARADRCPVCRVPLGPRGRCLLADKLHALLASTFGRPAAPAPAPAPGPRAASVEHLPPAPGAAPGGAGGGLRRARSLSTGHLPDCQLAARKPADRRHHHHAPASAVRALPYVAG